MSKTTLGGQNITLSLHKISEKMKPLINRYIDNINEDFEREF